MNHEFEGKMSNCFDFDQKEVGGMGGSDMRSVFKSAQCNKKEAKEALIEAKFCAKELEKEAYCAKKKAIQAVDIAIVLGTEKALMEKKKAFKLAKKAKKNAINAKKNCGRAKKNLKQAEQNYMLLVSMKRQAKMLLMKGLNKGAFEGSKSGLCDWVNDQKTIDNKDVKIQKPSAKAPAK